MHHPQRERQVAMMDAAISYQRFSSPMQARGDSTRRQTDLAEHCRRHGLRLIDTFLDAGVSGYTGANLSDESALKALLDAVRAGKFEPGTRLIVESLDRLSRREISAALRLFLDILDSGLIIVALIDGEQVFTKERVDNDITA
jgi:DNA invertase Pin-like site-specific DNA recombinase